MKYFILLLFLFVFEGCDLFTARDAETPNEPRSNFIPPVDPQDVIINLKVSLNDKNLENYLNCLIDSTSGKSFEFHSSGTTVFPVGEHWTKKNEEQYLRNLFSKISDNEAIILSFTNENYGVPQGDSVAYVASYTLSAPHNDSQKPVYYQGDIKLVLTRDAQSLWYISSWTDIKNSQIPTWSDLKGWFY